MPLRPRRFLNVLCLSLVAVSIGMLAGCTKARHKPLTESKYPEHVWPPPPDTPRIQLVEILHGRADVEADSKLGRALLGATPGPYDRLRKPYDVAFDQKGRVLVSDPKLKAILRFDLEGREYNILGTTGSLPLARPMGLTLAPDGTEFYVADIGLKKVVALSSEGKLKKVYGAEGELDNPTDVALSPNGSRLYVADSRAHRIAIFDRKGGRLVDSFGQRGEGDGQFAFPTSLAFDDEGNLFVVDQINSRVQLLTAEGEYLDQFGQLGVGFASFVRPKDVGVDQEGLIYVTDAAFNNLQIFDTDFRLLTFVGAGGKGPGQFNLATGLAIQRETFAVVDQGNRRVQLFRFIAAR